MGKPTPKVEVMKFLKSKQYTDSKDFAGECESVVMIAKGQSMQLTTFKCFPPANQKISLFKTTVFMIFFFSFFFIIRWCRCAGDMQIWNQSGLHIGIPEFTVQVCSGFILGLFFERDFGSSHSESWYNKSAKQREAKRCRPKAIQT